MQVADAEVLLHDVSYFGDEPVALDLGFGQLGCGGFLAHDAVFDRIECEKVTVGLSGIALVGIDLFDLLFCMTTERSAIGQKVGIVNRSRGEGSGQHEAVFGSVFLEAKMRGVVANRPVGFKITRELQRLAVFVALPFFKPQSEGSWEIIGTGFGNLCMPLIRYRSVD